MKKKEPSTVSLRPEKNADTNSSIEHKTAMYDMVVFCHLRWDFVYQRPQHLIHRLSKNYKTLFVEEPIFWEATDETFEINEISSTLHVLKPKVKTIHEIADVLKSFLTSDHFHIGWFYSPAFSVLIPHFNFSVVIYDCMDELSLFRGASHQLIEQEKYLLSEADVVFTGGTALYDAKKEKHQKVYCFPSSVDQAHFKQALNGISLPDDIKEIPKPIVGYFGVIDERIDMDLLYNTALLMPHISFVMIGPLAKISEEDLPRLKNIHFLGMKSYENLPAYLKSFDIAMMPFAMNDATRFISPTKTLEYMAGGVPIISTPIKDVVRHYSNCIQIVDSAIGFAKAIDSIFDKQFCATHFYDQILAQTSWSTTASDMLKIIKSVEQ